LLIGKNLGHYQILGLLGKGGMGEVYRAHDTRLDRDVALKVLPADLAGDPVRLERFQREARIVAKLNHPHIVTVYSVEEVDGVHFLTMELVEGQGLDEILTRDGLPPARVLDIGMAVCAALSAAHEKGVIHRDLKPANVRLTRTGFVKVLDFGLAKLSDKMSSSELDATQAAPITTEGAIMGTVPYMSPEQLRGVGIDARSDLFSLGVLLYEMAAGRRPFSGATNTDVISSILRDTPEPLTQVKPGVPIELGRIVARCLEKNPDARLASAKELREASARHSQVTFSGWARVENLSVNMPA
jgi:serine/threonine protein kinase